MTRKADAQAQGATLLTGKPYTKAADTDVRATFARIREQIERDVAARVRSEKRAALAARKAAGVSGDGGESAWPAGSGHAAG